MSETTDRTVEASTGTGRGAVHSLSARTRLAIVQHLTLGEHRVMDLTEHLGLAQSAVSKHLACLRAVEDELIALLGVAERLLEVTGDAVQLCPTSGPAARTEAS